MEQCAVRKKVASPICTIVAIVCVHAAGAAGERGSPAEAKLMLAKAAARYKAVGRAQALAEFTAEKPPFVDRDLYVMCVGADHLVTANGGFPGLVGVTADVLRDVDGRPLGQAIWEGASIKAAVSVRYAGMNPISRKSELKTTVFQKVGDDMCGVGVYDSP
jgi:hypothetical protein